MNCRIRLFVLALLLGCAGCATFESGDLPGIERWPEVAEHRAASHSIRIETQGLPDKFVRNWQVGSERVLRDAGHEVVAADASAQRRLLLTFGFSRQDIWVTRIWMGVTAVTFGVIPARTAQQFDLAATLFDGDGRELGTITRSVDAATWVGWLAIFALPFAGGGLGELVQDTTRSVVVEAVDKGWL